ncbi:uncharacterized protein LOC133533109 [Cydia pomonella]|uniref:uncharacterized protein LOC133533109 n=1 Tax=Cydia pomonella TaxID=82600 RepID=UPI002ADDBEC9|nr:uncharacterized protein LOC133533109 [Cydia pomonella]
MSEYYRDAPNILDYLNEDCWRAVLDYIPVSDIIKSERVCKQWQRVVLVYLRGVRIGIEHPYPSLGSNELHRSASWLLVKDIKPGSSFENWTNKLGSSVASTFCDTEKCLRIIGENCPNLEAVKFMKLSDKLLSSSRYENFRWLQRVCFINCPYVTDRCVSSYATSYALEELEIHHNRLVEGQCFSKIKPELKSLVINQCRALKYGHLQLALDRFRNLTKLVLILYANDFDLSFVAAAVSGMHKLEHLELYHPRKFFLNCFDTIFLQAVCGLKSLRHLGGEVVYTDQQLERVCRCCKELRSLDLEYCHSVTSRGVAAVCRSSRWTALGFHECRLSEDDIVACVNACPDLTWLDVRRSRMSRALLARVAAARRRLRAPRPLHFGIDNILIDASKNGDMDKYEQLILHF